MQSPIYTIVAYLEYIVSGVFLLLTSSTCAALAIVNLFFGIKPDALGFTSDVVVCIAGLTIIAAIAFWAGDNLLQSIFYQEHNIAAAIELATIWERVNIGFLVMVAVLHGIFEIWTFMAVFVIPRVLMINLIHYYIGNLKELRNKEENI